MTIIKWDPWRDLLSIPDELERFFGRTFAEAAETAGGPNVWGPCIDLLETNGNLVVRCELPGIDASEVVIVVDDDVLTIEGERKFETKTKEESYHRIERRYGVFRRVVSLPVQVDKEKVSAKFAKGLLEITMPKIIKTEAAQIKVEIAGDEGQTVKIKKDPE